MSVRHKDKKVSVRPKDKKVSVRHKDKKVSVRPKDKKVSVPVGRRPVCPLPLYFAAFHSDKHLTSAPELPQSTSDRSS